MATITMQLSDEEQHGLLSFVDEALRKNGLGALTAAAYWRQKLIQAQVASSQEQQPMNTKEEAKDASDNGTISGNALSQRGHHSHDERLRHRVWRWYGMRCGLSR